MIVLEGIKPALPSGIVEINAFSVIIVMER